MKFGRFSHKVLVLLLCSCQSTAVAHEQRQTRHNYIRVSSQRQNLSKTHAEAPGGFTSATEGALTQLATFYESGSAQHGLSAVLKKYCYYEIGMLCFLCCGGGLIKGLLGDSAGAACICASTTALLLYVIFSGTYDAWRRGESMSFACMIMCWWVFFNLVLLVCWCAILMCVPLLVVVVKNQLIKQMHAEYEKKKHELSGPRREYYEGEVFKNRCDALFDKYDTDGSGTLSMNELKPIVVQNLGEEAVQTIPLLQMTFDANGDSEVEKAEFVHMMQFLSMLKFKEGQFTEDTAYEVLQLNPDTATNADFKKSYRRLSLKYHPDKRVGVSEDEVKRDMAEINDAKTLLEPKFRQN